MPAAGNGGARGPDSAEVLCPARHRIRDNFPAGFLSIGGPFLAPRRSEILHLLRHHEEKARAEHPLARIMDIKDEEGRTDGLLVTTTDIRLVRDLGEALHRAYHGELEFHYNESEKLLRVHWRR